MTLSIRRAFSRVLSIPNYVLSGVSSSLSSPSTVQAQSGVQSDDEIITTLFIERKKLKFENEELKKLVAQLSEENGRLKQSLRSAKVQLSVVDHLYELISFCK